MPEDRGEERICIGSMASHPCGSAKARRSRYFSQVGEGDAFRLYPIDGGVPRSIPGIAATDVPVRFSADGGTLFLSEGGMDPPTEPRVTRLDLATGRRSPWLDLRAPDSRGICPSNVDVTPDGRSYLFCFVRFFSELYIIDGLR